MSKDIKVLGEDKCHIQLIESIIRTFHIRGIKPLKIVAVGAGGVLTKLKNQIKSKSFFDGEIILLDHDRLGSEIPKIEKLIRDSRWEIHLMILTPNCEGLILDWMGEKYSDPKGKFKNLVREYDITTMLS